MPLIVLVDYGAGNLRSVANALKRVGVAFEVSDRPEAVAAAKKVIFPGVGAAAACMRELAARGLDRALRECRVPALGICLGMQCLAEWSAEGEPGVACLGVLPGRAERFGTELKVPQVGWNRVRLVREDPLFYGIGEGEHFYFLHSYKVLTDRQYVLAETDYGGPYPSAVRIGNFWGVQFHPEKSGAVGLQLLRNFVERC